MDARRLHVGAQLLSVARARPRTATRTVTVTRALGPPVLDRFRTGDTFQRNAPLGIVMGLASGFAVGCGYTGRGLEAYRKEPGWVRTQAFS